jgi:ribonuclease P protein component
MAGHEQASPAGEPVRGAALRLPAACRIRAKRDFDRAYREGVRARGASILVAAAPSLHPVGARYGLSVSRKFAKSAVTRNRVRRVLREAFRLRRADLPALDLVLMPQDARRRWRTQEAGEELVELARKAARRLQERRPAAEREAP